MEKRKSEARTGRGKEEDEGIRGGAAKPMEQNKERVRRAGEKAGKERKGEWVRGRKGRKEEEKRMGERMGRMERRRKENE